MKAVRTWLNDRARAQARAVLARRFADGPVGRDLRDEIEEWAAQGRDHPALIGTDETLSFRALYERANRWARWAIVEDAVVGEPIVLLFAPRPERTPAWIGLGAVGAVATLIDPGLAPTAMAAAIQAIRPRHVIVDATLLPTFEAAAHHLGHACTVWVHGAHPMAYRRIDEALAGFAAVRLTGRDRRPLTPDTAALAVVGRHPDGRTRVAHLDHRRLMRLVTGLPPTFGAGRDDRLAVVETALGLEGLVAPTLALAASAPCRLIDATGDGPRTLPADTTVLHLDVADVDAPPPPALRLVVTTAECGDDANESVADPEREGCERRHWSIRRAGDAVTLRVDHDEIALPAGGEEMRT